MSFKEFQKYIDANFTALNVDFYRDLFPQIKVIKLFLDALPNFEYPSPSETEIFSLEPVFNDSNNSAKKTTQTLINIVGLFTSDLVLSLSNKLVIFLLNMSFFQ